MKRSSPAESKGETITHPTEPQNIVAKLQGVYKNCFRHSNTQLIPNIVTLDRNNKTPYK